jgi:hypothetical protein
MAVEVGISGGGGRDIRHSVILLLRRATRDPASPRVGFRKT